MTHLTVENSLKPFLQQNIQIAIDNKIIRQGKLILFNLKDYYIIFTIKIKNKNKTYEMPYPFKVSEQNKSLFFNYKIENIHNNDPILKIHKIFLAKKVSKYYDKVATIKTVN